MTYEMHAKIDFPAGAHVERCPVCGDAGELYRCSDGPDLPTETAVMCANGERFGPQDGLVSEGCLLYLPQDSFYRPTARDAIKYWNEYAVALNAQRRHRNWEVAKVLRATANFRSDTCAAIQQELDQCTEKSKL